MIRHLAAAAALALASLLPTSLAAQQHLPPSDSAAGASLEQSPRHGEWVEIDAGEDGTVMAWLVYPERATAAPVVVVIHEILGLSDWIRSVADSLAAEGFIAIAPDMLSGKGPHGGGTDSIEEPGRAIRELDGSEIQRRLDAVAAYATSLPAATSSYGVVGFCWGGSTSFRYATQQPGLDAAVVYYGGSPDAEALAVLQVPVLGLYGGDDARVTSRTAHRMTVVVVVPPDPYWGDVEPSAALLTVRIEATSRSRGSDDTQALGVSRAAWT